MTAWAFALQCRWRLQRGTTKRRESCGWTRKLSRLSTPMMKPKEVRLGKKNEKRIHGVLAKCARFVMARKMVSMRLLARSNR